MQKALGFSFHTFQTTNLNTRPPRQLHNDRSSFKQLHFTMQVSKVVRNNSVRQMVLSQCCYVDISKGWSREEVQSNMLITGSQELSNEGMVCQTARHMELSGVVLGLHTTKSPIFYDFMEFFNHGPCLGQQIIIRVNINAAWNKKNSHVSTLCWYPSGWNLYYRLNQHEDLPRLIQDCVWEIRRVFVDLDGFHQYSVSASTITTTLLCTTGVWEIYGQTLHE